MSSISSAETPPSLLALLQAGLAAAVSPFQPDLVYLFGSAVTGTAGPGSDVDVGILLTGVDPQERRARLLAMRRAMSQRLGFANLTVADLTEAEPSFLVDIVQGLCLYARSGDVRLAFETATLAEAGRPAAANDEGWQAVSRWAHAGILQPPPAIPADRLERLVRAIIEQTQWLLPIANLSAAEFLTPGEPHRRFATAHHLLAALEALLSVARLLTVTQGWSRSPRPDELLRTLVGHDVITAEVGDHLRLICLLRAPLTHSEDGIDFALVHAVVAENLGVFAAFVRQTVTYVETHGLLGA
jgi:uncharacterized protein YutE (UPF0331/DUF86 family)/predicted nucleotidyltransferase